MCDLNSEETRYIVGALGAIDSLAEQVRAHSSSIGETAYMDHEALAALLAGLRDQADTAQRWVEAKPQQHAM
ncbi:hypothetical protein [Microtetraspora niveoalba]|uniref:hypothetical protein n=1 Tax=Microtetraspora niveoalba TaxID=46175 RepID=UPI0012F82045|nr:hypothetical protein [Microtetraspora niveoalba]